MKRAAMLLFGVVNYVLFLGLFTYLAGFLLNLWVPKSIDSGREGPWLTALIINTLLVTLFGLQHSIMARPWFKRIITRVLPGAMERSTYVMFSNMILGLLVWQWRPMTSVVWIIEHPFAVAMIYVLFVAGTLIVPAVTFVINHFDLVGLRQLWFNFMGRAYRRLHFVTPGPYRFVRHPLYIGWIVMFWATPLLTVGHLLFAGLMTSYILLAIRFEERDLVGEFGSEYESYRKNTPMLIPRFKAPVKDEIGREGLEVA